jgi:hypothetical protein
MTIRKRNYRKEYDTYHALPKQRKRNNARKAARALMLKAGRVKKGDGMDVDHKDRNPGNNSMMNLSVKSKKANRGWRRRA